MTGDGVPTAWEEMCCADKGKVLQVMDVLNGSSLFKNLDCCDDSGWVCYGIGHNDPHFSVCRTCGNPKDYPCP